MLRVLMYFNHIEQSLCALRCVQHLRCKTYNYNKKKRDCELTDEEFDEANADTITLGWYNYATPSKVDGGWSSWASYTECTKTCASGTKEQYRECDSPRPAHGGSDCKGKTTRRVKCNKHECPVHGGWSSWMNSTECTRPCGNGTMEQKRRCDSPRPEHGGGDCKGENNRTVTCNTHECEVVNVALGKEATQSSTYRNDTSWSPSKAVDGDNRTSSYTERESTPRWVVDMGGVKEIKEIRLTAFVGGSDNMGLVVETRTKEADSWKTCYNVGDVKDLITMFQCLDKTTNARFVRIRSTKRGYLAFYEVEIFGY